MKSLENLSTEDALHLVMTLVSFHANADSEYETAKQRAEDCIQDADALLEAWVNSRYKSQKP